MGVCSGVERRARKKCCFWFGFFFLLSFYLVYVRRKKEKSRKCAKTRYAQNCTGITREKRDMRLGDEFSSAEKDAGR